MSIGQKVIRPLKEAVENAAHRLDGDGGLPGLPKKHKAKLDSDIQRRKQTDKAGAAIARAGDRGVAKPSMPKERIPKRGKYSRPSGYRKGVRDKVWENAKDEHGIVRDPLTGRIIRPGEKWDMGHLPGKEFRKLVKYAEEQGWTRKDFLNWHNDPSHYRPELPASNRSHKAEDPTDAFDD